MDKTRLREEISGKILSLDDEYIAFSNRLIFENLASLPVFAGAKRVFLYNSIGREVSTRPVMELCKRLGLPFALPRVFPGGRMDFCITDDLSALVPKKPYNIYEPPANLPPVMPAEGDVVIVPALCFDESLYRLGHGGGYYDRFLADCPAFSVGLCREKLVLPRLPREGHDVPVDCLVTEIKLRNR